MKVANPLGKKGEEIACEFLAQKGYRIIDRNVKVGRGELDIVAVYKNMLLFIEVKTRSSRKYGTPLEAIGYTKLQTLIATAQLYRMARKNLPELMRIDAIEVFFEHGNSTPQITHHEHIS